MPLRLYATKLHKGVLIFLPDASVLFYIIFSFILSSQNLFFIRITKIEHQATLI
jgi:hypothetical protein